MSKPHAGAGTAETMLTALAEGLGAAVGGALHNSKDADHPRPAAKAHEPVRRHGRIEVGRVGFGIARGFALGLGIGAAFGAVRRCGGEHRPGLAAASRDLGQGVLAMATAVMTVAGRMAGWLAERLGRLGHRSGR